MNGKLKQCSALLLSVSLCGCPGGGVTGEKLIGEWAQERQPNAAITFVLGLNADGTFSATNIRASLACPALPKDSHVSGRGRWELDASVMRVTLFFSSYSSAQCAVPYTSNVFVERGFGSTAVVAYPDGVDQLSSRIELAKTT